MTLCSDFCCLQVDGEEANKPPGETKQKVFCLGGEGIILDFSVCVRLRFTSRCVKVKQIKMKVLSESVY